MKYKVSNFTLNNIKWAIQGHYRAWIVSQYFKFNDPIGLASKIMECSDCLGNHPDCGCPWAELLLSDKPCKCNSNDTETLQ